MNKQIIISLSIIAIIAAVAVGGTVAYFSDTETSVGNTFTAGTIDISINNENPWQEQFVLADMKPCYTDYINFKINNFNSDPNPVNIFKKIKVNSEDTGAVSEPECTEQEGAWTGTDCTWGSVDDDNNNLSSAIWYDLYVEVYDNSDQKIWYQTIYVDANEMSIDDIYSTDSVFLGMIPANGYMLVKQSYHLSPDTGNWAQGDIMDFDIEVKGEQLYGEAWLENKDTSADPWLIQHDDDFRGTLTYEVKHPTFTFDFEGKVELVNAEYVLAAGYDLGSNVDTKLGEGISGSDGVITFSGDIELGKDLKDVKVWLLPKTEWNNGNIVWSQMDKWLWETGLIWYEDTDL